MEILLQDLKHTFRQIAKNPAITVLIVMILGLGIGANTAIFSMVYGVLLSPLPYEEGERLVQVHQQLTEAGVESLRFSVKEFADYRDQNNTFEGMVEYHDMFFTLLGGEEPRRVQTGVVSWNFFDVLGTKAALGRLFAASDERPEAEPVLVLSYGYWQREFGGDPSIVGRRFEMNDKVHTVIGVLPPVPQYPRDNDVYMPTSACPFRSAEDVKANRNDRMMTVFGRLGDGVGHEQADADLKTIAGRLREDHPEIYEDGEGYSAAVVPLREHLIGDSKSPLLLLLATVALVLLITCVNLANLTFARFAGREREMAIRTAIGADRTRLIRQLLTESVILACSGGVAGLVLAFAGLEFLQAFAARFTPRAAEVEINGPVLVFALLISVLTGLAFGLLPALHTSHNVALVTREAGSRSTTSVALKRIRYALVAVELAVSFVVLVGAGLMVRSFWKLTNVDAGFSFERILTVDLSLNWTQYRGTQRRLWFYDRLLEDVKAMPGVVTASYSRRIPLDESTRLLNKDFEVEGELVEAGTPRPRASFEVVSAGYFDTVGIPMLSGRDFDNRDEFTSESVVILSQSLAKRHFGGKNPIGKRITLDNGEKWSTVIGVAGDSKYVSLDSETVEMGYIALTQMVRREATLFVKTTTEPMRLASSIRRAVYSIDPEQPVSRIQTLEDARRDSIASPRVTMVLLGAFACVALVIASAGLGGVIAFAVIQQTQEIGIRMALGASRGMVLRLILRGALNLVATGLGFGIVAALILSRLMSNLVFGISTSDLPTFVSVGLVLVAVAGFATVAPALRAVRISPVSALRFD